MPSVTGSDRMRPPISSATGSARSITQLLRNQGLLAEMGAEIMPGPDPLPGQRRDNRRAVPGKGAGQQQRLELERGPGGAQRLELEAMRIGEAAQPLAIDAIERGAVRGDRLQILQLCHRERAEHFRQLGVEPRPLRRAQAVETEIGHPP